jgi:glycosyltransferase involved in cell wall biosynthesis
VKCEVNKKPDGSQELEADAQDLCAKMKILLTDSALAKRLAKNARKHWENNYTVRHMGTATMKLYKKVLSEQNQTFDHTYQISTSVND